MSGHTSNGKHAVFHLVLEVVLFVSTHCKEASQAVLILTVIVII